MPIIAEENSRYWTEASNTVTSSIRELQWPQYSHKYKYYTDFDI